MIASVLLLEYGVLGALAGTIGKGARQTYEHGIGAYASIMRRPCSLQKAIGGGGKLLRAASISAS